MAEEIGNINGVELCVESFGSPGDPCILLIMGAMASIMAAFTNEDQKKP